MRCKQCRRKVSKYAKKCPFCNRKIEIDSNAMTRYMDRLYQTPEERSNSRKRRTRIVVCTVVLAALALLFCGGSYLKVKNRWSITDDTLLYVKGNSLIAKDLDRQEGKVITDGLSADSDEEILAAEVKVLYNNANEHALYYAENIKKEPLMSYSIYEQNTDDWKEQPKRIAEHVRLCVRDDAEALYYVTYDSGYLYKYSKGSTQKILLPFISQLQYVKEYDRLLVICKKDKENAIDKDGNYEQELDEEWNDSDMTTDSLYHVMTSDFADKCVVEDLGKQYKVADGCESVYYLQNNRLFQCLTENDEAVIFRTNVSEFSLVEIEGKETLYYIQYRLTEKTYYDYVKDPYETQDMQTKRNEGLSRKETESDKKERNKREKLRKELLSQPAYTFEGTLHCYIDGKDHAYEENINGMVEVSKGHPPYLYKTVEFHSDYVLPKDGNREIVTKLMNYFGKPSEKLTEENYYVVSLYDYNEQTNAIPSSRNVLIMYEQSVYELKNETIAKVKVEQNQDSFSYYDLFNDPMKNQAMLLQDSVKRNGNTTYSVEFNGSYELSVMQDGEEKKTLMSNVEGYKILSDGRIVVVAVEEKNNRKVLYCIGQNQSIILVDMDVVNLIGEGAWVRYS